MNEFPKMLYHDTADGQGKIFATQISYVVVQDEEEMEDRIDNGWRQSPLAQETANDDLAELKAKAKALGIKLTGKSAETLRREIAEHDAGG